MSRPVIRSGGGNIRYRLRGGGKWEFKFVRDVKFIAPPVERLSFETAAACFRACFPFENIHSTRHSASSKSETGTLGTIPVQYY